MTTTNLKVSTDGGYAPRFRNKTSSIKKKSKKSKPSKPLIKKKKSKISKKKPLKTANRKILK